MSLGHEGDDLATRETTMIAPSAIHKERMPSADERQTAGEAVAAPS
jgi:hypothetical protein